MRNRNGFRVVLLLIPSLFLLLPSAIIVLILERVTRNLVYSNTTRDSRSGDWVVSVPGNSTTSNNVSVPFEVNTNPTVAIIAVCLVVYVTCAICGLGVWELRRVEGTSRHQRGWFWAMVVSSVVTIGASAAVLGYSSHLQASEKGWQNAADISNVQGRYTRETWACQVYELEPKEDWAGTACATAKATRFLLIPILLSAALVLISLWILLRDRGGMKWLSGGKGRYAGFPNLYELQPTHPGAGPIAHPGPQWPVYYVQPDSQQYVQQPVQQWAQAPAHGPAQQHASQPAKLPTATTFA